MTDSLQKKRPQKRNLVSLHNFKEDPIVSIHSAKKPANRRIWYFVEGYYDIYTQSNKSFRIHITDLNRCFDDSLILEVIQKRYLQHLSLGEDQDNERKEILAERERLRNERARTRNLIVQGDF
jgi:hypothetical protein